jgi:hypothetical protein
MPVTTQRNIVGGEDTEKRTRDKNVNEEDTVATECAPSTVDIDALVHGVRRLAVEGEVRHCEADVSDRESATVRRRPKRDVTTARRMIANALQIDLRADGTASGKGEAAKKALSAARKLKAEQKRLARERNEEPATGETDVER